MRSGSSPLFFISDATQKELKELRDALADTRNPYDATQKELKGFSPPTGTQWEGSLDATQKELKGACGVTTCALGSTDATQKELKA